MTTAELQPPLSPPPPLNPSFSLLFQGSFQLGRGNQRVQKSSGWNNYKQYPMLLFWQRKQTMFWLWKEGKPSWKIKVTHLLTLGSLGTKAASQFRQSFWRPQQARTKEQDWRTVKFMQLSDVCRLSIEVFVMLHTKLIFIGACISYLCFVRDLGECLSRESRSCLFSDL